MIDFLQCGSACGPGAIEEEVAQRWYPSSILHEAEEDEA